MALHQPRQSLSGLQKQVLSLYRAFLRASRSKPQEDRQRLQSFIGAQFRQHAHSVGHKDFYHIEFLLRRGHKQLQILQNSAISGFSLREPTADPPPTRSPADE